MSTASFGNGVPWDMYVGDASLTLDGVETLGPWFLLLSPREGAPSSPMVLESRMFDDPTGSLNLALPRTRTGSTIPGAVSSEKQYVFRVRRSANAQFDFVAVGRNEKNDICLPDSSVSRFHSFFREVGPDLVLQDAGSHNGTFAMGVRIAKQGEGEALRLTSRDRVRFGDVQGTVLNARDLYQLALKDRG